MRMLVIDPPPEWMEQRRKCGADRWDEVWDGVIHVPPMPTTTHQKFEYTMQRVLTPIAAAHGLEIFHHINLLGPGSVAFENYRGPDVVMVRPEHVTERGAEGHAEFVVEILSPHDESR